MMTAEEIQNIAGDYTPLTAYQADRVVEVYGNILYSVVEDSHVVDPYRFREICIRAVKEVIDADGIDVLLEEIL
jgi:hypothetical protein